jgi:hypothetical protein
VSTKVIVDNKRGTAMWLTSELRLIKRGKIKVLQQLWRGSDSWWEWRDVPIVEDGE